MSIETPARIAVIGAGPIGLETALYARYLGYDVDVYERGGVAENLLRWGHVRMFSSFGLNRSPLGLAALKAQDPAWQPPGDDELLSGRELATRYLIPLAHSDLLVDSIHERTEVVAISREGLVKGEMVGDEAREEPGFRLLVASNDPAEHGRQRFAAADVVIDVSGTFGNHNWLGPGGLPALGEQTAEEHIEYGLPDVLGRDRSRYASRSILLVGTGHSAATNLVALAELAAQAPDTWITWVARQELNEKHPRPVAAMPDDPFPERVRLTQQANQLAADDSNHISLLSGTAVETLTWHADLERFSVRLMGKHAGEFEFDRIIANVGHRPQRGLYRELHVRQDPFQEAALQQLANDEPGATVDPQSLVQPEPDFYILGAKSMGRDSRFLLGNGLDQIRALFTIIGDRPELNLYATMAGLV
jgi:thioredoxin reductase